MGNVIISLKYASDKPPVDWKVISDLVGDNLVMKDAVIEDDDEWEYQRIVSPDGYRRTACKRVCD